MPHTMPLPVYLIQRVVVTKEGLAAGVEIDHDASCSRRKAMARARAWATTTFNARVLAGHHPAGGIAELTTGNGFRVGNEAFVVHEVALHDVRAALRDQSTAVAAAATPGSAAAAAVTTVAPGGEAGVAAASAAGTGGAVSDGGT